MQSMLATLKPLLILKVIIAYFCLAVVGMWDNPGKSQYNVYAAVRLNVQFATMP